MYINMLFARTFSVFGKILITTPCKSCEIFEEVGASVVSYIL